jgi:hypothetical protein
MATRTRKRLTRARSELAYLCLKIEACVHSAFSIFLVARGVLETLDDAD